MRRCTVIGSSEKMTSDWQPDSGFFEGCDLVNMDFGDIPRPRIALSHCTVILCRSGHRIESLNSRGVVLTSGFEEGDENGVQYWSRDRISRFVKRLREPKSWEEFLVTIFLTGREVDLSRLPKSRKEVQLRLRQVETALRLSRKRGRMVRVVGSKEYDEDKEYKIVRSTADDVELLHTSFPMPKRTSLRRFMLDENGETLVLRLG